ncbi:MAG: tetratricopeptide repeat protein [Burkholderiales bacterium]
MLRKLFGLRRGEADRLIEAGRQCEAEGRFAEACERYQAAADAYPGYGRAHLNLGIALEARGDRVAAALAFERALALRPGEPYASYNLGRIRHLAGEPAAAKALLDAALAAKPDFPEALVLLADVREALGDAAGAESALRQAADRRPAFAGALRNYGALLSRQGRWEESAEAYRRAADADPSDAEACYELGNALVKAARPEPALLAFGEATRRRPGFAEAWCNRGNVLADRGSRDEALACFNRALEIRPDYAEAHLGLGNVYGGVDRLEDAAGHFRRALELDPGLSLARLNLGIVLSDQGRQAEALDAFRTVLAAVPGWPEARWALALAEVPAMRPTGDDLAQTRQRIASAFDKLERWCAEQGGPEAWRAVGIQQPFWLPYQAENNRPLLEPYGRACARLMGAWQARRGIAPPVHRARAGERLRIGIVSQHLRDHSVWHALLRGWFQGLDPARFALHAFCLDPQDDDATRYARSRAAAFVQGRIGLESWVEAIEQARPDVLIYPEVGMDPLTLRLASLRLAPVQAASWGHPETTALPTIDAYLSADGLEPAGAQDHYSERLVRLPHLGCHLEPRSEPSEAPDLAALGAAPGVPLLISPGTPFKYAPEHDGVLPEIVQRLGACRVVLFRYRNAALAGAFEARLRQAFEARGVDFDRHAVFVPWMAKRAFHGLLSRADVFLDTIGFSGFNTALQALECNLPVVTIEGRFLRGRLASGILRRMGLDELVAADAGAYVDLAVRLARDPDFRREIRGRLEAARPILYRDDAALRGLEDFLERGSRA